MKIIKFDILLPLIRLNPNNMKKFFFLFCYIFFSFHILAGTFRRENISSSFPNDTIFHSGDDTLRLFQLEPISIIGERALSIPGSGQYISSRKLSIINQPNINFVLRKIPGVNVRDEEGCSILVGDSSI